MNSKWKWFIPGYIWSLPLTIVGLILAKLVYRSHSFRLSNGLITCIGGLHDDGTSRIWGKPGGQTFGIIQVYKNEYCRGYIPLRVHETCHTVQAFIGGVLFAVAYGVCFIWFYAWQGFKGWKTAYRKNPFEGHAYGVQAHTLMDSKSWY